MFMKPPKNLFEVQCGALRPPTSTSSSFVDCQGEHKPPFYTWSAFPEGWYVGFYTIYYVSVQYYVIASSTSNVLSSTLT